jgi:phage I-like protein
MLNVANHQSSIVNLQSSRHFAWELFSAGPSIRRDGKELHEIPVAVAGSWVKGGHRLSISESDLRDMVRNFEKRQNDMVVIDYEHASEQPEVARGGPVPAAGWIHGLTVDDFRSPNKGRQSSISNRQSAVLVALVEWTPEAKKLIESGQYRFFSPSIDWGVRDKESGKAQGATLTSGALTNHPFLEELPPIMLTDLDPIIGSFTQSLHRPIFDSVNHPITQSLNDSEGATMKRLSIKKLTEGDQAGHHGIFYGDELVGYMTDEDFAKYAQMHLPTSTPTSQTAELSELLSECGVTGVEGERPREQLIERLRRLAEFEGREARGAARAQLLSAVVENGRVASDRAAQLARDEKISLADFVSLEAAERLLSEAVAQGKILPRDRAFFFTDALERPEAFAEFIAKATPVVRLGADGIGSAEMVPVDQEVDRGVRRLMSERSVSYAKALKQLFRENPGLEARYRQEHTKPLGDAEQSAATA